MSTVTLTSVATVSAEARGNFLGTVAALTALDLLYGQERPVYYGDGPPRGYYGPPHYPYNYGPRRFPPPPYYSPPPVAYYVQPAAPSVYEEGVPLPSTALQPVTNLPPDMSKVPLGGVVCQQKGVAADGRISFWWKQLPLDTPTWQIPTDRRCYQKTHR